MMTRYLLLVSAVLSLSASAAETPQIVGWRGDGTGCFPQATIPVSWGRVSKAMDAIVTSGQKPAAGKTDGAPGYWGAVQDWLVIGPFTPADATKALDEDFAKEAEVQPAEGDKIGEAAWKKAAGSGNLLNIDPQLAKSPPGAVAYAHAYLYSPAEANLEFRFSATNTLGIKAYFNGKLIYGQWSNHDQAPARVKAAAGWNRVLVKVVRGDEKKQYCNQYNLSVWKFTCQFFAVAPTEFNEKNIAWVTVLPADGAACPIVVGDRVYLTSEPSDVVCVERKSGKILWVRSNNYFDTLTDAERKDAQFAEVLPLSEKLKNLNDLFATPNGPSDAQRTERSVTEKKIGELMAKIDPKFKVHSDNHPGNAVPTPISDGKHIYAWFGHGVAACYDLDGNRQWIRRANDKFGNMEHGRNSSPALVENTLVVHLADIIGIDSKTGEIKWQYARPNEAPTHQSILRIKANGRDAAFIGDTVLDPDGKLLWNDKSWTGQVVCPTAVLDSGTIYQVSCMHAMLQTGVVQPNGTIPAKKDLRLFAAGGSAYNKLWICSSPVYHDGLLYTVDMMGVLRVYDPKTLKLIYDHDFGCPEIRTRYHSLGAFYGSPYLAGNKIYLPNLSGTTFVIEPGPKFQLVSINKIELHESPNDYWEHPEAFASSPFAAGNQLFIRGTRSLYCVSEK